MNFFLLLILFISSSLVNNRQVDVRRDTSTASYNSLKANRIIGGRLVLIRDNPFVVSIVIRPRLNETTVKLLCGGVIIQKYWALTAAHCLKPIPRKLIISKHLFVLGNTSSWDLTSHGSAEHYIDDYQMHENYLGELVDYDYDIAIVKVKQPFNHTYERPITFAGSTYQYVEDSNTTVYGWGITDANSDSMASLLKSTTLMLSNFHDCVEMHQNVDKYLTPRMVCAWKLNTDSCAGDSGGPLVQDNTLIGLVSWGTSCASDWPGVYTRISEFSVWIINKMEEMKVRKKRSKDST